MAIDFTNRNPQDANGIYSLRPAQQTAWIETNTDGSWTGKFSTTRPANTKGWVEVRYSTATLNDGRQYRVVLDGNGQPISEIGDTIGQDDDVTNRWKQGPGAAQHPPGGLTTRTINGKVYSWNPETRAYDIPTGETPASATGTSSSNPRVPAGSVPAIEGTPIKDANGNITGYDNSEPIRVYHTPPGPDGQPGPLIYEPLTPAEVKEWREKGERARNPGGKTDAEIRAEGADVGKPTGNTRQRTEGGQTIKETEYALPNGTTVWRAQTEQARPGQPIIRPDNKGGSIIIQTMPDGTVVTTPRPDIPSEAASKYTEIKQDPTTGAWSGLTRDGKWESLPGGPGIKQTGTPAEPAGAPPPNTTYGQIAAGLTRYRDFLNQQVLLNKQDPSQGLTPDAADRLMQARLTQAKATMEEQSGVVSTQTQLQGQGITQRGQSLRETESRRTAAGNAYSTTLGAMFPLITHITGPGAGAAFANVLTGLLGQTKQMATEWGGMRDVPEVPLGPAAAAANQAPMPGGTFVDSYVAPPAAAAVPAAAAPEAAAAPPSAAEIEAQRQAATGGFNRAVAPLLTPPPPVSGPISPPAGESGNDPNLPVGLAPNDSTFLDAYGQPAQRPTSNLQALLEDSWIPNHLVAEAFMRQYPNGVG